MSAGGIHDQLEGGFHRYAVDAQWLVPHFEKMLYDNAQLVHLYLDAFLVSQNPDHAQTARRILDYVSRSLTHPEGGFHSAEDADSDGQEGKFYCWTHAELASLLDPDELHTVVQHFGITPEGNFLDHSHPQPLRGLNVLSLAQPRTPPSPTLDQALEKMRAARNQRTRPLLDDKVLASWNGLMLGAFARAQIILDQPDYLTRAENNLAFLQTKLWDPNSQTLYHRWRDGERDSVQLLDAYAFLLAGTLELYETTLTPHCLEFALQLATALLDRFHDPDHGGFFQSTPTPDLILRLKPDYDGAEPSGNSVAALALLRLAAITGQTRFRQAAEHTLRAFAAKLQQAPQTVPHLLRAFAFWLEEPRRVIVAGDPASPKARALLRAAHSVYQPNRVVHGTHGPVDEFARSLPTADPPVAYPCSGTACQPPSHDPQTLRQLLLSEHTTTR
jgi:uncharacterized protein